MNTVAGGFKLLMPLSVGERSYDMRLTHFLLVAGLLAQGIPPVNKIFWKRIVFLEIIHTPKRAKIAKVIQHIHLLFVCCRRNRNVVVDMPQVTIRPIHAIDKLRF